MTRSTRKPARTGMSIAADLMLAPMVVLMRLPVMASESRTATDPGIETLRAVNEKTTAVAEGFFAAQMSLVESASRFWPDLLAGRTPSAMNGIAAERAMHAALGPMGKTVKANYKRLSSKRG